MKCCRECKALNPQTLLYCEYCSAILMTAPPSSVNLLAKFNALPLLKRRLIYLAAAMLLVLIVGLSRCWAGTASIRRRHCAWSRADNSSGNSTRSNTTAGTTVTGLSIDSSLVKLPRLSASNQANRTAKSDV